MTGPTRSSGEADCPPPSSNQPPGVEILVHWQRGLPSGRQLDRLVQELHPRLIGMARAAGLTLLGDASARIWRTEHDVPPPDPFDDE